MPILVALRHSLLSWLLFFSLLFPPFLPPLRFLFFFLLMILNHPVFLSTHSFLSNC
ncbi:hypothetical protein IE53DRAFT_387741 [Violaceomyces palustris]|uniref:Uncharacterized protein n=1 Tax=Violaceomyces palustris TaxID=1673888 RepID=A0ACD0NVZ2_9BASI|nr:hypothetical protein IE53DRAFT_387741 [Violaceomyces palustris]